MNKSVKPLRLASAPITKPHANAEERMYHDVYDAIMEHRPHGPIALTGHSVGGLLAFEMARLLVSRGREVDAVILIDAIVLGRPSIRRVPHRLWKTRVEGSRARVRDLMARRRSARAGVTIDAELLGRESERRGTMLQRRYRPGPYAGRVVCIRAIGVGESPAPDKYTHVWARVASSVEVVEVRGEHTRANSILSPENAPAVAAVIRRVLAGR